MGNYYCKLVLQDVKTWKITTQEFETHEALDNFTKENCISQKYNIVHCIIGEKYANIV